MSKYRFKTKEEFIRDGLWNEDHPYSWNSEGNMNKYLGQDIPEEFNSKCDKGVNFKYEGWGFSSNDYILKENYVGRTIKALINSPNESSVKKGEQIKIIGQTLITYKLDKTSEGLECMRIEYPLNLSHWELLPETKVETPVDMKAIQEEAKKRFPIGCRFKNTDGEGIYTLLKDKNVYEICGTRIWAHESSGCLYENGKWAKLISLPEIVSTNEFKKGEYIVLIGKGQSISDSESIQSNLYLQNHCYKVKENDIYLKTELDSGGNVTNGWKCIPYNPNEFHKTRNWRYATPEEIAEYERIGKPYDVTTLQKKEEYTPQVGDYVVMEKASGWGYSPDNNGCIAIVKKVSSNTVQHLDSVSYTVPSIDGTVVNPKNLNCINFTAVPIMGFSKERIFRKALPHEIPSNLPKKDVVKKSDSPLEICRQKYKKGMVVKSAEKSGMFSGTFTINVDPEKFKEIGDGVDYFGSEGFLYLKGKYAEILSYPDEESKLENSKWLSDPIVEERINTLSIKKETFIEDVQSVDVILRTKKKSIKF